MKQKYEEFRKKCYEKYQLNWMLSHGYSLQDLIDAMNEKYMEDDSREYTTPGCYYEDVLDNLEKEQLMEVIRILDQLLENLEQELRLRNTKCSQNV